MSVQKTIDSRLARSEATKQTLMRAAEKLIAERGMENVSIRNIVTAAGQKNESALQYHFKNLTGLFKAIHKARSEQVHAKRAQLIEGMLVRATEPTLRDICMLMVEPTYALARDNPDFRRYVKAFGHELVLTNASSLAEVANHGGGGRSGMQTGRMLRAALAHLDTDAFQRRMDAAVRLCAASMYHQARQKHAFKGERAELFLHNLVDALAGLLSAPVSRESKSLATRLKRLTTTEQT